MSFFSRVKTVLESKIELFKDYQELTDTGLEEITICFGRFNPPTKGHKKLLDITKESAGENGEYRIYTTSYHDTTKNPLKYDEKIKYMSLMFPEHVDMIVQDSNLKNIIDILQSINEEGYLSVNIVVGSNRVKEFENLTEKYNGEFYNFDNIKIISSGERDICEEGIEGTSSSKLRMSVLNDDYETFKLGVNEFLNEALTKNLYETLYEKICCFKKIPEGWEISPKLFPKSLRENYINEKIFDIGSWVENMNHGLVGKIVRRGANYVIAVTEEGIMFKSWLTDLNEVYEIGTDEYRSHAEKITPGQYRLINKIRKNLKKSKRK